MPRVWHHLDQATDWDYARYFSGVGLEYALVCPACREHPDGIEADLREVSPERFARIDEDGYWEWDKNAIIGRPQVLVRPADLSFLHEEVALAGPLPAPIADLRPIPSSDQAEFLVLAEDGELFRVDPGDGGIRRLMNVLESGLALEPKLSLHVSPDGEMAAVVEARGRYGVVLDLETGRPTMRLDRGDYLLRALGFPGGLLRGRGRITAGPRDRLEPPGRLRPQDRGDPDRPIADLLPSGRGAGPSTTWTTSTAGWPSRPAGSGSWTTAGSGSPVGVVTSWSLRRWVEENPWESEDGPSKRALCDRAYFWGGPLCWIDDRTVAVWGYGNDDENLIPAALLFDVESGRRVRWFAGPVGSFAFDRHLFSYSAGAGTSVWDVATGERLLHDASFCPTAYQPGAGMFVTVMDGRRSSPEPPRGRLKRAGIEKGRSSDEGRTAIQATSPSPSALRVESVRLLPIEPGLLQVARRLVCPGPVLVEDASSGPVRSPGPGPRSPPRTAQASWRPRPRQTVPRAVVGVPGGSPRCGRRSPARTRRPRRRPSPGSCRQESKSGRGAIASV